MGRPQASRLQQEKENARSCAPNYLRPSLSSFQHRKVKDTRTINDEVEALYLKLVGHESFRLLLEAVYDELAVEGSLSADNYTAAVAIRNLAREKDKDDNESSPQVATLKLATISKALQVVSALFVLAQGAPQHGRRRDHAKRSQRQRLKQEGAPGLLRRASRLHCVNQATEKIMSKFDILRPLTPDEYDALKSDIKRNGQRFPIIRDQNNVTIDGHQRERVMWEIPIPTDHWKIEKRTFKDDAERLAFVISANIHRRQSTPEDRKVLAERLYTEHSMTMEQIAQLLGVSKATISNDLVNCLTTKQLNPAKTSANPKGAGRPKANGKAPRQHKYDKPTEDAAATLILDEHKTTAEVKETLGVSEQVIIRATERERGRREAKADPEIRREDLSLSMRAKFDAAIRQERKRLALEYRDRLWNEIKAHTDAVIIPNYKRQLDEAAVLVRTRKGYMSLGDWENIRRCLHPDNSASEAKRNRAFDVWNDPKLKLVLVPEAENPASSRYPLPPPLPTSAAEWQALKDKVSAERKAKRAAP